MTDLPPAGDRPDPDSDAPTGPAPESPMPDAPMPGAGVPQAPNMADIPASPLAPPVETPAPGFSASPLAEAPVAAAAMPDAPAPMPDAPAPEAPVAATPPPSETEAAPVAMAPAAAVPAAAAAPAWESPPAAPPGTPEVPGAPGRYFAATITRLAALLIDSILLGIVAAMLGFIVGGVLPDSLSGFDPENPMAFGFGTTIASLGALVVSYLYFFLSWRSAGKATPGQRVFKMQVGNAFDGATLTTRQITIRWLTLFAASILTLIPALAWLGGLGGFVWSIVLLITTATSTTKQGLHDRWAGSAVVATGPQNTALAWGCLIAYVVGAIVLAFIVIALLAAIWAVVYSTV